MGATIRPRERGTHSTSSTPVSRRKFIQTALAASAAASVSSAHGKVVPMVRMITASPAEDADALCQNPDMGWVLYDDYPMHDKSVGGTPASTLVALPHEDFPAVDNAALMFCWNNVEKQQGVYDFSKVDYAYDYWKKRGKNIMLRMATASWVVPGGQGPPDYLIERMAPGQKEWRGMGPTLPHACPHYWELDYLDHFYQERLQAFLEAVAKHYSNSGHRPLKLIDLRGFGTWGEWHNGFIYPNMEYLAVEYKEPYLHQRREALKSILNIWSAAFPKNHLALSYSYDPDSPQSYWSGPVNKFDPAYTKTYDKFVRFSAFDYALAMPNITWRRDGCGGAVHSNERLLNMNAFNTLKKGPMMSEFICGYSSTLKQSYIDWAVDDALSLHPNYMNIMSCAGGTDGLAFVRNQPEKIKYGMQNMGYRLRPVRVAYPTIIHAGKTFGLRMQWINQGVGRAMCDYHLHVLLADAAGMIVARSDAGALPTSRWIKGSVYSVTRQLTLSSQHRGKLFLALAMADQRTGGYIRMPLKPGPEHGYIIGAVNLGG